MTGPDLGLYIHVPFCRQKCVWCAFASEEGSIQSEAWVSRILRDLENPPIARARWATVYFGGGTPSLLLPDQLDRVMAALSPQVAPGAEITFEANPESLVSEHLAVFRRWGGTRLSLGIQSFSEEILVRHGRPTRQTHLDEAKKLASDWPGSLSLDLICGLGGQTEVGQIRDLDEALSWNPDHLSFYSLTVEPETPLFRRVTSGTSGIPDADETSRWWLDGRDRLESAGLFQYEVSNFAKSGAESIHNGRYWALEPWWGIGPSATSFLPTPAGKLEYRTEPASVSRWLAGESLEVETPTPLDLAKDRLLAGMRRRSGVPRNPWETLLPKTLEEWGGRISMDSDRLFLLREDFPFLDAFLRRAFAELDERPELR